MNERTRDLRDDEPRRDHDDVRRAYAELGDEPVPPALDARVMHAARAAVRPARVRPRWIVPVSLAASVVLAVGVALDVREAREQVPSESATPSDDVAASAAAKTAPRESAGAATASNPEAASGAVEDAPTALAVPAAAAPQRGVPSYSREAASAAGAAASAEITSEPAAESRAKRERDERDDFAMERRAVQSRPAPPPPAPAAPRAEAADSAPTASLVVPPLAPEAWLARIEALRREGRTAEADTELARFVQTYPDYVPAGTPR